MSERRPHDRPTGDNPSVRNLTVEVLSDQWYTLRRATFDQRGSNGQWTTQHREAYDRGNGVAALLHDHERDTVLLVRQYRAPAHLNDHSTGILVEVPAGLLDDGEDAETAIRRELVEEVGHDGGDLRRVWTLYMSPGSVTEHVSLFVGSYVAGSASQAGGGMADEGEYLDVIEVGLDEAVEMTDDGRIVDAKTVLLIQYEAGRRR